jgi:hypothetical protein
MISPASSAEVLVLAARKDPALLKKFSVSFFFAQIHVLHHCYKFLQGQTQLLAEKLKNSLAAAIITSHVLQYLL